MVVGSRYAIFVGGDGRYLLPNVFARSHPDSRNGAGIAGR
jgi:hypothetical protein